VRLWHTNPFETVSVSHGQGCTVWDTSGKAYLDLLSGVWCNVLGYGHPRWVNAIHNQAQKLVHAGSAFATSEIEGAVAKLA